MHVHGLETVSMGRATFSNENNTTTAAITMTRRIPTSTMTLRVVYYNIDIIVAAAAAATCSERGSPETSDMDAYRFLICLSRRVVRSSSRDLVHVRASDVTGYKELLD